MAEALTYSKLRQDLESIHLLDLDITLFVDGSCFRDHMGNHAVVWQVGEDKFQAERAENLPQPCSAQKAKLKALMEAYSSETGKTYIYTDSAYAHAICHHFGAPW